MGLEAGVLKAVALAHEPLHEQRQGLKASLTTLPMKWQCKRCALATRKRTGLCSKL